MKKFIYLWGPVLVWMGIIFWLSAHQHFQVAQINSLNFLILKNFHALGYFVLFLLSHRAIKYDSSVHKKQWGITALLLTSLYAMSDEIHQTFVPTRDGTLRDVIIDTLGALLAWLFLIFIIPKLPKQLTYLAGKWQIL